MSEGAGAVAAAAVATTRVQTHGRHIAVVVSGANIDHLTLTEVLLTEA